MKPRKILAALVAAAICAPAAQAITVGSPYVYGNLHWTASINAPGLTACNDLLLDAMGDLVNSTRLLFYGSLNCGSGGYNLSGSGYLAVDGTIAISLTIGAGTMMQCPRLVNFGGLCTIYNSSGFAVGTAALAFR